MGGNKPLTQATGDWVLLVQAAGGQAPLVWAKGSRRLSPDLQVAGMDLGSHLGGQREAWSSTTGVL